MNKNKNSKIITKLPQKCIKLEEDYRKCLNILFGKELEKRKKTNLSKEDKMKLIRERIDPICSFNFDVQMCINNNYTEEED